MVGVSAQQPSAVTSKTSTAADCTHRSVPVTVLNAPENAELQALDLQVRAGNTSPAVLFLEHEQLAPRVVLLLDTSGSMQSDFGPKWKHALIAAEFVLEAVPVNSQVALVTFDIRTQVSSFASRERSTEETAGIEGQSTARTHSHLQRVQDALPLFGRPEVWRHHLHRLRRWG